MGEEIDATSASNLPECFLGSIMCSIPISACGDLDPQSTQESILSIKQDREMRAILILLIVNTPLYRKECKVFGRDRLRTMTLQPSGWSTQLRVLVLPWAVFAFASDCQNLAL